MIFRLVCELLAFYLILAANSPQKPKKWPYLGSGAKNEKNKGTLFSRTFKVRENKVTSFY